LQTDNANDAAMHLDRQCYNDKLYYELVRTILDPRNKSPLTPIRYFS